MVFGGVKDQKAYQYSLIFFWSCQGGLKGECLNHQPLDLPSPDQVLVDDFVQIFLIAIAVPSFIGIHDQAGAFCAAIQASGIVDPDFLWTGFAHGLNAGLCIVSCGLSIMVLAARLSVALIGAKEDVVFVIAHRDRYLAAGETDNLNVCDDWQTWTDFWLS